MSSITYTLHLEHFSPPKGGILEHSSASYSFDAPLNCEPGGSAGNGSRTRCCCNLNINNLLLL
jgi:hypothetical protein